MATIVRGNASLLWLLILWSFLVFCPSTSTSNNENLAISNLQKYIQRTQVRTDQPNPDYASAVDFLQRLATDNGLESKVLELVPGKPIFLAWVQGSNQSLSTILLNSHMDVVPVETRGWTMDAFAGIVENGRIYGRGTQDMKSVTIQYFQALGNLLQRGWKPDRTILVSVVPDEEIGGTQGMGVFVESEEFQKWNIGFELDEGLANPDSFMWLYYGERQPWWLVIGAIDQPAHGATLPNHTAIQRLYQVEEKILSFRQQQQIAATEAGRTGEMIGVNLVYLRSGVTKDNDSFVMNMVPGIAELGLDIRVPPRKEYSRQLNRKISEWLGCAEEEISNWSGNCSHYYYYRFVHKVDIPRVTSIDPLENPYYAMIQSVFEELSIPYQTAIFPASTDARYLREKNIPCFGWSPIHSTPVLLHDNDEYIPIDIFLQGISIYEKLIATLGTWKEKSPNYNDSSSAAMPPHEEL